MQFIGDRCKYHFRGAESLHTANINSRQLCEYLMSTHNITPRKGLTLNPNVELNNHFIRGYFDGDGSIRKGKWEAKITSGSEIFVGRLYEHFTHLDIYCKIRPKGNAFDICFERKDSVKKLLEYLYGDATIYLDRKYQQCVALLGN